MTFVRNVCLKVLKQRIAWGKSFSCGLAGLNVKKQAQDCENLFLFCDSTNMVVKYCSCRHFCTQTITIRKPAVSVKHLPGNKRHAVFIKYILHRADQSGELSHLLLSCIHSLLVKINTTRVEKINKLNRALEPPRPIDVIK